MTDISDNMVLRTIYLPKELDQTLKSAAIRGERSKGDVIRELIQAGLQTLSAEKGSYLAVPTNADKKPVRPAMVKRKVVTAGKPGPRRPGTRRTAKRSTAKA